MLVAPPLSEGVIGQQRCFVKNRGQWRLPASPEVGHVRLSAAKDHHSRLIELFQFAFATAKSRSQTSKQSPFRWPHHVKNHQPTPVCSIATPTCSCLEGFLETQAYQTNAKPHAYVSSSMLCSSPWYHKARRIIVRAFPVHFPADMRPFPIATSRG